MIIIPARLESTRFPKKVLCNINGYPMVIATARRVENLDEVAIATDSKEVFDIAQSYGFLAVMTDVAHTSGTDRINEAANKLNVFDDEVIINVQADEPFIESDVVKSLIDSVKQKQNDEDFMMASCYKKISHESSLDPNFVKVIINKNSEAIYFSRSQIPYPRAVCDEYFGHLGLYGFTRKTLREFCSYEPAYLENIEKLEQLRAIYNGKKIQMIEVESESFGIDTKEDLDKALKKFVK